LEKYQIKENVYLFTTRYFPGNSYVNLYLIHDESPILINVGPPEKSQEILDALSEEIPLEKIKYVLLLDSEREHVGGIPVFVHRLTGAKFITSYLNYDLIINYTSDIKLEMMREKWVLRTGRNTIRFFESMIPTPESLFVYAEKILFTGSAFAVERINGSIDPSDRSKDIEELFYLYRKRVHKIKEYMEKLENLQLDAIAPAHGAVLSGNPGKYITQWKRLSNTLNGQR